MAQSAALISTEELARRMGAPALRIFDCTTYLRPRPEGGYNAESGRANYDKGHMPGAAFLDLGAELSDPHSKLRFTLPPLDRGVYVVKYRVLSIDGHVAEGGYSFTVKGEGTSPRSTSLTDDEREVAFAQAAHYAAVAAAESITPRAVRESIELDPAAPSFEEGYSMITSNRLADARAIWEAALRQHDGSAPLFFNLAALSEATGDVASAGRYFERAQKLQPDETRYRSELSLFHKRRGPRQ